MYYTYMIRCEDNSIYTGITTNLERRIEEHINKTKRCAKYTYRHQAVKLETAWASNNRSAASKLEYGIKKISKKQKEELIKSGELEKYFNDKLDCRLYEKLGN